MLKIKENGHMFAKNAEQRFIILLINLNQTVVGQVLMMK